MTVVFGWVSLADPGTRRESNGGRAIALHQKYGPSTRDIVMKVKVMQLLGKATGVNFDRPTSTPFVGGQGPMPASHIEQAHHCWGRIQNSAEDLSTCIPAARYFTPSVNQIFD